MTAQKSSCTAAKKQIRFTSVKLLRHSAQNKKAPRRRPPQAAPQNASAGVTEDQSPKRHFFIYLSMLHPTDATLCL